ncbi:MAG: glycosyltransferase family 4 protein, partial [Chloroflexi bacterium]|nr:glycosyltransferase family 4 protein [Chloroflexota bacterium]
MEQVDRDRAEAASASCSDKPTVFLYVGRLEPHKGIQDLLDAFVDLPKESRKSHLIIVGDGSMRRLIESAARTHPAVEYLGRLSGNALIHAYSRADVFVLPSRVEPWGLVINEAMAASLAVIATDRVGCVDDLVREGENGRVLKPGELIIPLSLLAFIGSGITFVNGIFNTTTRWGFLAALLFFLLVYRGRDVLGVLGHPLFWAVLVYAFWGLMTVAWSEVPQISLAKSLVFIWVSTTMLIAGYSWVMRHERAQTLDFLWLFAVFALTAAPTGQIEGSLDTGEFLYAGLTVNPNHLGFILAAASAWLMWRAYLVHRQNRRRFALYAGLVAFDLVFLFLSHSRASL